MNTLRSVLAGLALTVALAGCDNFFGNKTDSSFITPPVPDTRAVAYVAVQPSFTGFTNPIDIIAGNDQLFYVVDQDPTDPNNNKIVCLDEAGKKLSSRVVPGATAVAQDRRLDILVLGRIAFTINGETNTVPAIYRFNLKKNTPYGLANAESTDTIIQPFYFTTNRRMIFSRDSPVEFNDIAILPDNRFLVTRTGPGADLATSVPDDAVLLFDKDDKFISNINISGEGGAFYNNFFKKPFGIATIPPTQQVITGNESQDFIVTTQDAASDTALRVKYIQTVVGPEGISYQVKALEIPADTSVPGFLYQNQLFHRPKGIVIANDQTGYIWVVDRDSLRQFSPNGYMGVKLATSLLYKGYNNVNFGGTGSGPYRFNNPVGVAYSRQIVYVADSKNGEIKRFKLSTDFQ